LPHLHLLFYYQNHKKKNNKKKNDVYEHFFTSAVQREESTLWILGQWLISPTEQKSLSAQQLYEKDPHLQIVLLSYPKTVQIMIAKITKIII